MFDTELDYFIKNQETLTKQYGGRVLVIKGEKIVSTHGSQLEAYLDAQKKGELGNVMIQNCVPGKDAYTVSIATIGLVS